MVTIEWGSGFTSSLEKTIVVPYQPCTIQELLTEVGINTREVGIVLVNKQVADIHSPVQDNATICVLPIVCGG